MQNFQNISSQLCLLEELANELSEGRDHAWYLSFLLSLFGSDCQAVMAVAEKNLTQLTEAKKTTRVKPAKWQLWDVTGSSTAGPSCIEDDIKSLCC